MGSPITVTLEPREPPAAVVALVGEHDAYSSQRLENELAMLLDENRRIVVDLRDAAFMDSTCLSALLGARHRAARSGLGFVLVLSDDEYTQVHQLLNLTGLASTFEILPALDEALRAARAGRAGAFVRPAA